MALRVGLSSRIIGALETALPSVNNSGKTLPTDSKNQVSYLTVRFVGRCELVCKLTSVQRFTIPLLVAGASTLPLIESLCSLYCLRRRNNKGEKECRIDDISLVNRIKESKLQDKHSIPLKPDDILILPLQRPFVCVMAQRSH